jgi:N-acetylglucosaminyldiphosphoundecaprenol N-acetyl-beta-D-mannosaminyltransferase
MRTVSVPDRYPVIGTRITPLTLTDAVDLFLGAPANGLRLRAHFCTTHTLVEANHNPKLLDALNAPEAIAAPDGMPLVWIGRAMGRPVARVCGPDLMPALIDRSREIGGRHFFYGGAPGVPEKLAADVSARFPGVVVAGTLSPPFRSLTPAEDRDEMDLINSTHPDYVWVGLGSPKQDLWIAEHRDRLDAAVLLAVGAAFDFHSGGLRRAPVWMQRTGTEWLFRVLAEPRRLLRRYAVSNSRFAWLLARQAFAHHPGAREHEKLAD